MARRSDVPTRRLRNLPGFEWFALSAMLLLAALAVYLLASRMGTEKSASNAELQEIVRLHSLAASNVPLLVETLDHTLVTVEAGEFTMGSDDGTNDEYPRHRVYLDAFEMDRFEVTNAQFEHYLQATGRPSPPYWNGNAYPTGQAAYPVVGVVWEDADEYCRFAGKRLPTEAEWEKACRGTDGRIFPWGDAWDPGRANVDTDPRPFYPLNANESDSLVWDAAWQLLRATPAAGERPGLNPVGSCPGGASPYGIMDMAGNASEWVADWYNWGNYTRLPTQNPVVSGPPWNHSLRGSPWHDPVGNADLLRNLSRCAARSSSHAGPDPRLGLRCARSISQ